MKKPDTAPDWMALIDQLTGAGVELKDIALAMGVSTITRRMIWNYRMGVQPLYWRGEGLVKLWCDTLKRQPAELPRLPVLNNRRAYRTQPAASTINLPQWPPVPQPAVKPIKKRGRPPKVVVA